MKHSIFQHLSRPIDRDSTHQPETRKPRILTITLATAILGLATAVITFIAEFLGFIQALVGHVL